MSHPVHSFTAYLPWGEFPREPGAFILFDNSECQEYTPAFDLLRQAGFHRTDFWGTGPVNPYEWCTSVFFRPEAGWA